MVNISTTITRLPDVITDLITPVGAYMLLRDKYPNTLLLESSDSRGDKNSMSYIVFDEIATFTVTDSTISTQLPNAAPEQIPVVDTGTVAGVLHRFLQQFHIQGQQEIENGIYGYTTFESVKYFDTIQLKKQAPLHERIPEMRYAFHRYVLAFNHFNNNVSLVENTTGHENPDKEHIITLLLNKGAGSYTFTTQGSESSNLSDDDYIEMVRKGKAHCYRGDVFQIVLSRQFSQAFRGDEFNVYRALRRINPSPYLFYFDFGTYKIFGSSPESQIIVQNGSAMINPIAGTFKRTGNDEEDRRLAKRLAADEKENAEHVMLVDLARNDLNRNATEVNVDHFREVHYYSHVLHLVSEVSGKLKKDSNPIKVFGDTFPAGTLSGAPKYKALQLIDQYENAPRQFYGGAIGFIGCNGAINQAITIRSFMSKNNTLFYQAGAGIVAKSDEQRELQEVNNKLAALKAAIRSAENFNPL